MNRGVVRIYPNLQYTYNVVAEEDLDNHVDFNKTFRPGCVLYVDGVRVNNGCLTEEGLVEPDALIKTIKVDLNRLPTRPYR